MTQKFWANWQKRAGETKTITLNEGVYIKGTYFVQRFFDVKFYHFENFDFGEDSVTIKYFDTLSHAHRTVTIERKNIKTVTF